MIGAMPKVFTDPVVMASIITGLFGLVALTLGFLLPHLFRQNKVMAAVHEQVQNDHKSNLRDDIDLIARRVDLVLEGQGQLREDLAVERRERIAGDDARNGTDPTDSRSSTWR